VDAAADGVPHQVERSGLLIGSPRVKMNSGACSPATWSMSGFPSPVDSSCGSRWGCAEARQCLQARSQACVTSQATRKGRSLQSRVGAVGSLIPGATNLCNALAVTKSDNPAQLWERFERHFYGTVGTRGGKSALGSAPFWLARARHNSPLSGYSPITTVLGNERHAPCCLSKKKSRADIKLCPAAPSSARLAAARDLRRTERVIE
jgi:hypothetical protein